MKRALKDGIDSTLFAERIKEAREDHERGKLTQKELGKICNITDNAISRYENADQDGGQLPSVGKAAAIAKATGYSLDYLVGLSNIKHLNEKASIKLENYKDAYDLLVIIAARLNGSIYLGEYDYIGPDQVTRKETGLFLRLDDPQIVNYKETMDDISMLDLNRKVAFGSSKPAEYAKKGLEEDMKNTPLPPA